MKASQRHARKKRSMDYASPYASAKQMLDVPSPPEFLEQRISSFAWRPAFLRLCELAAMSANRGIRSEEVRRATIDPLLHLRSSDGSAAVIVANAQRAAKSDRDRLFIAHEQALSYLQHLVLLWGAEDGDAPAPPEVSLWLTCAGDFIGDWRHAQVDGDKEGELIALMAHAYRFNREPDLLKLLVRASTIFHHRPSHGLLADSENWAKLEEQAFPSSYDDFFEQVLGPMCLIAKQWQTTSGWSQPIVTVKNFTEHTTLTEEQARLLLKPLVMNREEARVLITQHVGPSKLPHAPSALLHRPLVELAPDHYCVASPWAVINLIHFGGWAHYLGSSKAVFKSADLWLQAFGGMFESWCRTMAAEAKRSSFCRAKILMPVAPGNPDEVEDVVLLEGNSAVMFSVKARLMHVNASRAAISAKTTLDWYEEYFFEEKGRSYRGGAIRQLDARISMLRRGDFGHLGVSCNLRILPVIVSYDSLGESDLLYRWIESRCATHGLLQQKDIGPVAIASVSDFEDLMARAADGASVVQLLRRRESVDRHRRLDQILEEHKLPQRRRRLPYFMEKYEALIKRIKKSLFSGEASSNQRR